MKSLHLHGVVARGCQQAMKTGSAQSISYILKKSLESLNLSGCVRLNTLEGKISTKVGSGVSASQCANVACEKNNCHVKISSKDGVLVYNNENIMVILSLDNDEEDLLKDGLAILLDTVQSWIENHDDFIRRNETTRFQRICLAEKIDIVHSCLLRANQHLTESHYTITEKLYSDFLSTFPFLALESDQEENILDIVKRAMEKQKNLIELQISHSKELQSVMKEAIVALMETNSTKGNLEDQESTEVINIELF